MNTKEKINYSDLDEDPDFFDLEDAFEFDDMGNEEELDFGYLSICDGPALGLYEGIEDELGDAPDTTEDADDSDFVDVSIIDLPNEV
jgi:hypothetical protein